MVGWRCLTGHRADDRASCETWAFGDGRWLSRGHHVSAVGIGKSVGIVGCGPPQPNSFNKFSSSRPPAGRDPRSGTTAGTTGSYGGGFESR
jgi:hypothetical protein